MDTGRIRQRLAEQEGLISRRQVLACGGDDTFIEKRVRRRDWTRAQRGVFVEHSGDLSWLQRAWAAVLYYSPAALCHQSALEAHGVRSTGPPDGRIHIAVARDRRVVELAGVALHRVTDLSRLVQPNRRPARLRLEHALLQVASLTARSSDVIAVLADACQARMTTPSRLLQALDSRTSLPHPG